MEKRQRTIAKAFDWRNAAMNAALTGAAGNGVNGDQDNTRSVLVAVRRNLPNYASVVIRENAGTLMRFLETCPNGFADLLGQTHDVMSTKNQDAARPYFGWYKTWWKDDEIEVIIDPKATNPSKIYVIGTSREALVEFVRGFSRFVQLPVQRCLRFVLNEWTDAPDLDAELQRSTWDDLVLEPGLYNNLRQVIESFVPNQQMFSIMGFPWKRGVLLVGPPGTGKTMICKAAAASLPDLPFLYVADTTASDRNNTIRAIFERARQLAPCLLVFEDLDGLITPANRAVFLNELDGFKNNEGVFIIASSNHPGKIDEALLKRPSRFDRVFHIGLPSAAERLEYARRFLARPEIAARTEPSLDVAGLAERVAARTDGFTPAYLKEAFLSAALALTQDGQTVFGQPFAEAVLTQIEDLREHLRQMKDPQALAELVGEDTAIGFGRSRKSVE